MEDRRDKVYRIIDQTGLDACILKGMDNIFYLTGFKGSEGSLLVTREALFLITDFRYITYAREVAAGIKVMEMTSPRELFSDICDRYRLKRIGFDSHHTTYEQYQRWIEYANGIEFIPLRQQIEEIRRQKGPEELDTIRRAVDIATDAFLEVLDTIRPGRTEREVANLLDYHMRRLGADRPSFDTIVASGARAALPHAVPTDKQLMAGEAVIIDFGAQVNGYCSDETCTVFIGEVQNRIKEVFTIVNEARWLAIRKARIGVALRELDSIARGYIEDAGYGEYFRHGTGHGVGIAVHEAPSISSSGDGFIEEDMVFTIEPGIYIPNIGGVRLEEMVLVTKDEPKVLTKIKKGMLQVNP